MHKIIYNTELTKHTKISPNNKYCDYCRADHTCTHSLDIYCINCGNIVCPYCALLGHHVGELKNDNYVFLNFENLGIKTTSAYATVNNFLFMTSNKIARDVIDAFNLFTQNEINDILSGEIKELKPLQIEAAKILAHDIAEHSKRYNVIPFPTIEEITKKPKILFKNIMAMIGENVYCKRCFFRKNPEYFTEKAEIVETLREDFPNIFEKIVNNKIII